MHALRHCSVSSFSFIPCCSPSPVIRLQSVSALRAMPLPATRHLFASCAIRAESEERIGRQRDAMSYFSAFVGGDAWMFPQRLMDAALAQQRCRASDARMLRDADAMSAMPLPIRLCWQEARDAARSGS